MKYAFALLLMLASVACSSAQMVRDTVYIGETEVSANFIGAPIIKLRISGDLPTACHKFVYEFEGPTKDRIDVTVYSTIGIAETCIQGLHHFDETIAIPMSGQPDGVFQIYLNNDLVGEIPFMAS